MYFQSFVSVRVFKVENITVLLDFLIQLFLIMLKVNLKVLVNWYKLPHELFTMSNLIYFVNFEMYERMFTPLL